MEELGKKIDEVSNHLTKLRWEIWTEHVVFTWKWWLLVFICILFLVLFVVFIKKEMIFQSFSYYGLIYILNRNLDDIATAKDWYDYRIQLEPIISTMLPANLFAVPITLTLIYQKCPRWKDFLLILALISGGIAFLALPMMKDFGFYLTKDWNAFYSFLSLVAMASLSKLTIDQIKKVQEANR